MKKRAITLHPSRPITFEDLKWAKMPWGSSYYYSYGLLCYHAKVVFPNCRMVRIEWAPNAEKYKFITQEGVYDGTEHVYYEDDVDDCTFYKKNDHELMLELKRISVRSQVSMPVKVYESRCTTLPFNLIFWNPM